MTLRDYLNGPTYRKQVHELEGQVADLQGQLSELQQRYGQMQALAKKYGALDVLDVQKRIDEEKATLAKAQGAIESANREIEAREAQSA